MAAADPTTPPTGGAAGSPATDPATEPLQQGMSTFKITIPAGFKAKTVPLTLPWGAELEVKIPRHAKGGDVFEVQVRSPPGWKPPPQVQSIKRTVAIPEGAKPGDNLELETPWGAKHLVQVPAGGKAGETIEVTLNIPGGTAGFQSIMEQRPGAPRTENCDHCSKPGAANSCTRCKAAFYCGADCQKAAWPAHKGACKKAAKKLATKADAEAAAKAATPTMSLGEASIRRSIEADPKNFSALSDLGNLLGMAKDFDGAEKMYCRSIDANPNVPATWVNLASLLCAVRQDYEGAELAFRRAIELDPKHDAALVQLAQLLANKKKDYDEAEVIYLRYIEENKTDSTWVNTLKQIREQKAKAKGFVQGYPPNDVSYDAAAPGPDV